MSIIISTFFGFLLKWYVWIPIVGVLTYLTIRNYRKAEDIEKIENKLLILEIPRTNDKKELAAEQMFASLHGILRDKKELRSSGGAQEHISFEIAAVGKLIRFYVWTPIHLQSFIEGQIYAQYPSVQIHEADEDYTARQFNHDVIYTSELTLTDNEMLPIKTFQSFEVDPLAGITATLAKLESDDEEIWLQFLARPIPDSWHTKASSFAESIKKGGFGFGMGIGGSLGNIGTYTAQIFEALWRTPEESAKSSAPRELSERDKTRISEIEKKSTKLGYQVKIRIAYLGNNAAVAKQHMQAIVGTFKQFNSTNLNGFKMSNISFKPDDISKYVARLFVDKGYILNIEELASVYHLPHTSVETPNIVWATVKTAEPPTNLPVLTKDSGLNEQISAFGLTNFRGIKQQFGLWRQDRSRHVYIIGQTGAGKSGLLELFTLSDIYHNQGYAIIDPHGDFAINNLKFIPAHRLKDVVYFNPADTAYPIGFNPMEVIDPTMKNNISSEVIGVLKRMFGDSWGPRLEYILRYTILALLDFSGSTMLDITRMLTDKKFREKVLECCTDMVVLQFWRVEFATWNEKYQTEAVAPVLNKVGAFTANPIIRNIIGQPKSTFNIRTIMDEGKILVVNLSRGLIGEDNAGILGAFLVTKIQLAAMSRADTPDIKDRRPFFLYVDEFQNFATDSFATILSEARKYALNLTVANQYISQMEQTVRDAVFGNVGTMISFRVSPDDASILAKQFEPQFEPGDLLQMHNRDFVINMVIKGEKALAFSARTLEIPPSQTDYLEKIIDNSRTLYSRSRSEVENDIEELLTSTRPSQPQQQNHNTTKTRQPQPQTSQMRKPSSTNNHTETPRKPLQHQQKPTIETMPNNKINNHPNEVSRPSISIDNKPKRKRRRPRKKSPESTTHQQPFRLNNSQTVAKNTSARESDKPAPSSDGNKLNASIDRQPTTTKMLNREKQNKKDSTILRVRH